MKRISLVRNALALATLACSLMSASTFAQTTWAPTKPVELIVPAGLGGGADQMARFLQGVITKHKLMTQPLVVVNKAGGAGAEGFLDVKSSGPDGHKLVITLSNLFTTPLATGVSFNWKEITPVAMLALDEFVLWVNQDNPAKTTEEFLVNLKASENGKVKLGGTGAKQEDQIISVAMEKVAGKKFTYVPYKGGGEVAVQLVGKQVDATVNNPMEAVNHWRSGAVRALCVFDSASMPYEKKITSSQSWKDLPSCRSKGLDVEYLMLRGIFMGPGAKQAQVDYYVDIFKKIRALPEWRDFMETGAFRNTFLTGDQFKDWLRKAELDHVRLMAESGFLAKRE
jgi:putative tricarboxylic transport membrane protein